MACWIGYRAWIVVGLFAGCSNAADEPVAAGSDGSGTAGVGETDADADESSGGADDASTGDLSRCDCLDRGSDFATDCTEQPITECGTFQLVCSSPSEDSTCEDGPPTADELAAIDCIIAAATNGTAASLFLSRRDDIGQFSDSRWIALLGDGTAVFGGQEYDDLVGNTDASRFTDAPDATQFEACRSLGDALAVHKCLVDLTFAGTADEYCSDDPFGGGP